MKKSLKSFRNLKTKLSYTQMKSLKGGIDETQCHQQSDLDCNDYTSAGNGGGNGNGGGGNTLRNDMDD